MIIIIGDMSGHDTILFGTSFQVIQTTLPRGNVSQGDTTDGTGGKVAVVIAIIIAIVVTIVL